MGRVAKQTSKATAQLIAALLQISLGMVTVCLLAIHLLCRKLWLSCDCLPVSQEPGNPVLHSRIVCLHLHEGYN